MKAPLRISFRSVLFAALVLILSGCDLLQIDREKEPAVYDNVVIIYQAGYYPGSNDLSYYLNQNLRSLKDGFLPSKSSDDAVILVSHYTKSYSPDLSPHIIRMYSRTNRRNTKLAVMDTLRTLSSDCILTDMAVMNDILTYIRDEFPSRHYGLLLSSHGTGWLPEGYYLDPGKYDPEERIDFFSRGARPLSAEAPIQGPESAGGYVHRDWEYPDGIPVKTWGVEHDSRTGLDHETPVADFARGITIHPDYIIFDSCLMGGVEVAWQMRELTDAVVFSQAEILADGMHYPTIISRLLDRDGADLVGVATDFFNHYDNLSGSNRSATISCIDCLGMEPLAGVCRELFEKYRSAISSLDPKKVQEFFRYDKHWFYDLKDILVQAGMSAEDGRKLDEALESCVMYKAATATMLKTRSTGSGGFDIRAHCGLSMYLPSDGSEYLNGIYRDLDWNKATSLVK